MTGDINEAYLRNLEESGRGKRGKGGSGRKRPAALYLGGNKFAAAA